MLILSIIFWCIPDNRGLGIAAMVVSLIGTVVDFFIVGPWAFIDLIIFWINTEVYKKHNQDNI